MMLGHVSQLKQGTNGQTDREREGRAEWTDRLVDHTVKAQFRDVVACLHVCACVCVGGGRRTLTGSGLPATLALIAAHPCAFHSETVAASPAAEEEAAMASARTSPAELARID